ncbi:uncharacterized protein LOC135346837 [Halichondria panicea]|uniref:uncharacterized protein LOC135346837 n=1 Tax=Halichondria panicea TaxID=6063 RepID=UPI00312BBBC6
MVCLLCECLNVTVHCKDTAWKSRPVAANNLFPDNCKERLVVGRETVYEVDLDVAGVFAEHRTLLVSHSNGDWVIHRCCNCNTDVYISHIIKEDKTFVTAHLMSEVAEIRAAKTHERYSTVFKVIVREGQEDPVDTFSRKRVSSMSFGREDPVMKTLHEQMKSYLNKEQQAMEERIRKVEEAEREKFSQLQKKTHSERTSLFSAISRARENVISDAIRDSMLITTHTYTEPAHTAPLTTMASRPTRKAPSPTKPRQNVTITLRDPVPTSTMQTPRVKSPDMDDPDMFSLDGFDEGDHILDDPDGVAIATGGGVAFPQSDDEEISTDDSSFRDVSDLTAGGIAMSVPLSIPMYPPQRAHEASQQSQKFDPNHVGNSIKALALSVQDTSLFGELPRPRMKSSSYARKW